MMKHWQRVLACILCLPLFWNGGYGDANVKATGVTAGDTHMKMKVLMLGNSHTYYNNAPMMLENMIIGDEENDISSEEEIQVNYLTWGGQCLYEHGSVIEDVLLCKGNLSKFCLSEPRWGEELTDLQRMIIFVMYGKALYSDYHSQRDNEDFIHYDYMVFQERIGNTYGLDQEDDTVLEYVKKNPISQSYYSGDFYKNTWSGGIVRICYLMGAYVPESASTKYIINAMWSTFGEGYENTKNRQNRIDQNAEKIQMLLQEGFQVPDSETEKRYVAKENVGVAYTGKKAFQWMDKAENQQWVNDLLLCDSEGNVISVNPFVLSDGRHPTHLGSYLETYTIYSVMFPGGRFSDYYGDVSECAYDINILGTHGKQNLSGLAFEEKLWEHSYKADISESMMHDILCSLRMEEDEAEED